MIKSMFAAKETYQSLENNNTVTHSLSCKANIDISTSVRFQLPLFLDCSCKKTIS